MKGSPSYDFSKKACLLVPVASIVPVKKPKMDFSKNV